MPSTRTPRPLWPQVLYSRLVPTLSSPDFLCQRYAAMGIANLATNMGNQPKIMQAGALQPIISLARRDNGDLDSQRYAVSPYVMWLLQGRTMPNWCKHHSSNYWPLYWMTRILK